MTIKEIQQQGVFLLRPLLGKDVVSEVNIIMKQVLHVSDLFMFIHGDESVSSDQELIIYDWFDRRSRGEPMSYLSQEKGFFGLSFFVNKHVLIPRPETEILVEEAIYISKRVDLADTLFIDVGTGSGCIALSVAHTIPEATVMALDISPDALQVVQCNIEKLGCSHVQCVQSDLLGNIGNIAQKSIVLFANLPYIPTCDMPLLEPTVRDFEPWGALDGGVDGVELFQKLFAQITYWMRGKDVYLLFECDPSQIKKIKKMIRFSFFYPDIRIIKDLSGKERAGVVMIKGNAKV